MNDFKHVKVSNIKGIHMTFLWLMGQKDVNKHVNKQNVSHISDTVHMAMQAGFLITSFSFVNFIKGRIN